MNNEFKKLTIDTEKVPVSWVRQRVKINTRILETSEPKRRFRLIHRWVNIAALIVACLLGSWIIANHSVAPKGDLVVASEDIYIEENLPASLVVLNDFDSTKTDYEEFIEFMVP
jgi:hypothetical protein